MVIQVAGLANGLVTDARCRRDLLANAAAVTGIRIEGEDWIPAFAGMTVEGGKDGGERSELSGAGGRRSSTIRA